MMQPRLAVLCLIFSVAWLASCEKQAPPPPKAEPPKAAAPVDEALKRLTAEVYIYAYPLVLTDVTRAVDTAGLPPDTFRHNARLPDATSTDVSNPNADFLYSQAWLDLSKGPVVLSVPDMRGRYYLVAVLGAWTNVVASLSKRTTDANGGRFAIVGPKWKGKLPGGVSEVQSPTDLAWLFARVQVKGEADAKAATRLQSQFNLKPLGARPKSSGKAARAETAAVDVKTDPREQVARMDAATFFTRFAMLLPGNPPAKDDAPMLEKMKALKVVAGHPFDVGALEPLAVASIDAGMKTALDAIRTSAKGGTGGDIRNGWAFDNALGRWGTDYGKRAVAAYIRLGLNAPEDALFMATRVDADGHPLDGTHDYVLHLDAGKSPTEDGFWSLSLYNDKQHFVASELNRYNIGSDSGIKPNADGSVDIYIQSATPGSDRAANWLPAPKGNFNVVLRTYWPMQDVVDGKWNAPGLRKVK
ncbi:MAG: DUF1254 domain-containing protein [Casimicrobiaceae bacterium]